MTSVLIVDDDDTFRTTIGRDLAEHGYAVRLAQNAAEAATTLSNESIDILLTDLRMPGADGIDLLDRIRTISARTRAILMSGYATARDYQRAIECGAVRVLCKPFTSSELLQAIRQAIDCETGFRGSIHGLSLVDLLQMFHYARRSLAILVDGWAPGHVFLEEGRIVHASYRDLQGEEALRAILAMPAGSLRTMVLPDNTPQTITRSFEALLLDALRELDEAASRESASWDFNEFEDSPALTPATAIPVIAPRPRMQIFFERLRKIDGYTSAALVDSESGVILGTDGDHQGNLQVAVTGYAELYRHKRAVIEKAGLEDRVHDIVLTMTNQVHVLHALGPQPTCFLYIVLERRGNIGLVTLALAAAEAALDG